MEQATSRTTCSHGEALEPRGAEQAIGGDAASIARGQGAPQEVLRHPARQVYGPDWKKILAKEMATKSSPFIEALLKLQKR
jgi:hypothetical protein